MQYTFRRMESAKQHTSGTFFHMTRGISYRAVRHAGQRLRFRFGTTLAA
jgi:hypothetical protein